MVPQQSPADPAATTDEPRRKPKKDADERAQKLAESCGYLLEADVCRLYDITPKTAEGWRKRRHGPVHIMAGNRPLYPREGVAEDLQQRARERATPTTRRPAL